MPRCTAWHGDGSPPTVGRFFYVWSSPVRVKSQPRKTVAVIAPMIWAVIKPGTAAGMMPENVLVNERAMVTAGFANDVEDVNQ